MAWGKRGPRLSTARVPRGVVPTRAVVERLAQNDPDRFAPVHRLSKPRQMGTCRLDHGMGNMPLHTIGLTGGADIWSSQGMYQARGTINRPEASSG